VVGFFVGPALLLAIVLIPLPLTREQQRLLGLIVMTITYWMTRALPIPATSLLALALVVVLGIARAKDVFGAFSSPTLFLLISGFIMTQAMTKHGLGRRIALRVLTITHVAGSTHRIVVAFGGLAALMASVIENAAVVSMLVPIAVGVIQAFDDDLRRAADLPFDGSRLRFGTALMLIISYGATVGVLLTPFGPQTQLGWAFVRERFDLTFDAGTWMMLSFPIVAALFSVLCTIVLSLNRPEASRIPGALADFRRQRRQLGPMGQGEINTAIAFGVAIALWLLPPIAGIFLGYGSPRHEHLMDRLSPAAVAVIGAVLLFVLPVSRKKGYTLRWRDTRRMDWGPVLLMGSGLALAKLMADSGLAQVAGDALAHALADVRPLTLYAASAALAMLFSELTSNVVSVSILVPLIARMSAGSGADPVAATLTATFAALYGFMLPISTSANVIVYGTGQVPFMKMVRTGALVDLSGIAVIVLGMALMLGIVHVS
jgi:sodium-dependent dicarboxylate transporter 2/3/5